MSTFTDGAPPSVNPEPDDVVPGPERAPGRASRPGPGTAPAEPDSWLQDEIRRRMAERAAAGGGARHARRGAQPHAAPGGRPVGGVPRHATPVAAPASPTRPPAPRPAEPVVSPPARPAVSAPVPPTVSPPARPVVSPPARPAASAPVPPAVSPPAPRSDPGAPGPRSVDGPTTGLGVPAAAYSTTGSTPRLPPVTPMPLATPPPASAVSVTAPGMPVQPPSVARRAHRSPAAGPQRPAGPDATTDDTPASGVGRTAANPVENLRRVDPPAAAATPVGPGLSALDAPPRSGRRPDPPSGPAAARLLSPPPSPPSTPTGIPLGRAAETGPFPAPPAGPAVEDQIRRERPYGPRPTASPELEASGKVLWNSITPPGASVAPAPHVAVPSQRGPDPATAPPVASPASSPEAPNYVDYDDYDDDDYEDPELDAEIAEAARREAESSAAASADAVARVRVVLAERRSVARPVRTVVDVQEGTGVGGVLRRQLIRDQLVVALRFTAVTVLALGMLPILFAAVPEIGRMSVFGIRLPWLVLGGLVYPFLLGLGWWHARTAERVEKGFADHVQG